MIDLPVSREARRLTPQEKEQFHQWGYVKNLPVFDQAAVPALQDRFRELHSLLPAGTDMNRVNNWHKANRWVYDLSRTPAILDYVEDLLGPDFFQWGAHIFSKFPGDGSEVPWHQDAQYWPLQPQKTVTVWLAFFDTDSSNGAMHVVRGSHHAGTILHRPVQGDQYVLAQQVDQDAIEPDQVVPLDLKAGEISLHDDGLIHGSGPNDSDRMRAGQTMRYCPTEVRCDLEAWPHFESYMVRGVDRHSHNPIGKIPAGNGFPIRLMQTSSEFT
jgi:ectoine hydroxylase-related dioxygenase (phytanoyl-CoA dioxygenase family)